MKPGTLDPAALQNICRMALAEDIGSGDATTLAVVPEKLETEAHFVARKDCVCAGLPVVKAVFAQLDEYTLFRPCVMEGESCPKGTVLAVVTATDTASSPLDECACAPVGTSCLPNQPRAAIATPNTTQLTVFFIYLTINRNPLPIISAGDDAHSVVWT